MKARKLDAVGPTSSFDAAYRYVNTTWHCRQSMGVSLKIQQTFVNLALVNSTFCLIQSFPKVLAGVPFYFHGAVISLIWTANVGTSTHVLPHHSSRNLARGIHVQHNAGLSYQDSMYHIYILITCTRTYFLWVRDGRAGYMQGKVMQSREWEWRRAPGCKPYARSVSCMLK